MTSMPASRSARAMIFAPRSCPSRPGFAITTLIFPATVGQYRNVKLTVVGCSPAWPNPGSAHSGYLVTNGERRVLLDCGPGVLARRTPALGELARDADVFLCEATLLEPEGEPHGHLSAGEARAIAADANARRLLITHRAVEYELDELVYDGFELEL